MSKLSKNELLAEVRRMLQELLLEQQRGASAQHWTKAHSYLDGYMRGLVQSGSLTQRELLSLVTEQRVRVAGPALGELSAESEAA